MSSSNNINQQIKPNLQVKKTFQTPLQFKGFDIRSSNPENFNLNSNGHESTNLESANRQLSGLTQFEQKQSAIKDID